MDLTNGYAATFHAGNFYYFGGYIAGSPTGPNDPFLQSNDDLSPIFRLNAGTWTWSIVDYPSFYIDVRG